MEKFDPKEAAAQEAGNGIDTEKSHAESIASDIYGMIEAARESGLGMEEGFQNRPLSSKKMSISYLFLPRQDIVSIPGVPDTMKRQVRTSNVLGVVEENGKVSGIHLLCAMDVPFAMVDSEATVLENINEKGIVAFSEHLRVVLKADLAANVPDDSALSDAEN